jgi:hypothetical protein
MNNQAPYNVVWITYKLEKDETINFKSVRYEQDSQVWTTLQTQVFEFSGQLYLSVLYQTHGVERPR